MRIPRSALTTAELSRQAAAVAGLARALVEDEHGAEDLAQDVWLAAIRKPPSASGSLRGWLSTTVRRLASNQRRGAARRRDREQRFPREEAQESHAIAVERLEIQRLVLEQVLALREPSRTAIYLRYWEGLEPKAIAERVGAPVKTIKSRLARALAELREVLDAKHGGDRGRWLSAVTPIAFPSANGMSAATATVAGALIVKQTILIVLAVGLTLFALKAVLGSKEGDGLGSDSIAALGDHSAGGLAPATSSAGPDPVSSERIALHDPSEPVSGMAADAAIPAVPDSQSEPVGNGSIRARVTMVDEPSASARVVVTARDEKGEVSPALTGKFAGDLFEIGGLEPGTYWVSARTSGWTGDPVPVELTSDGDSKEVDILLTGLEGIVVRVRTPLGRSFAEALADFRHSIPWPQPVVTRELPVGDMLDPGLATAATFLGTNRDDALETDILGELTLREEPPLYVSLLLGHLRVATQRLDPLDEEVLFVLDPEQYRAKCATFRVRIHSAETGEPVVEASVSFATNNVSTSTMVPVHGGFATYSTVTPGPGLLSIFAPRYREVRRELRLEPGDDLDLGTIELERETPVEGRVDALEGVTDPQVIAALRADLQRNNHQRRLFGLPIDAGGSFRLNLGPYEYLVWAEGMRDAIPWRAPSQIVDPRSFSGAILLRLEPTVVLLVRSARLDDDRRVRAFDAFGRELSGGGELGGGPVRFDVLTGTCNVVLDSPSGQREQRTVDVGPGGLEVEIE